MISAQLQRFSKEAVGPDDIPQSEVLCWMLELLMEALHLPVFVAAVLHLAAKMVVRCLEDGMAACRAAALLLPCQGRALLQVATVGQRQRELFLCCLTDVSFPDVLEFPHSIT